MMSYLSPRLFEPDLWERAGWIAMAYATPRETAPALALVFLDRDAASAIFTGWLHALGIVDVHEFLRISIVEGEVGGKPPGYSVHVSLDAASVREAAKRLGAEHEHSDVDRSDQGVWKRVRDPERSGLRRFAAAFARERRYLLMPAVLADGVEFMPHLAIGKQRLALRRVCDVGLVGDPDAGLWTR